MVLGHRDPKSKKKKEKKKTQKDASLMSLDKNSIAQPSDGFLFDTSNDIIVENINVLEHKTVTKDDPFDPQNAELCALLLPSAESDNEKEVVLMKKRWY